MKGKEKKRNGRRRNIKILRLHAYIPLKKVDNIVEPFETSRPTINYPASMGSMMAGSWVSMSRNQCGKLVITLA